MELPFTEIGGFRVHGGRAVFIGAGPVNFARLVTLDLATGEIETLRRSKSHDLGAAYVSPAEPVEFPTTDGRTAHGLFFAPRNRRFRARRASCHRSS